jgi:hypothetical protein
MSVKLDTRPARTDLTSRECSKIIGSIIGGLILMAPRSALREAVTWWAVHFDEAFPAQMFSRAVSEKPPGQPE